MTCMLLQKISGQNRLQQLDLRVLLYQAALKGIWQEAKDVLDKYPDALQVPITEENETALHIAAAAGHVPFVTELVERMNENDLNCRNNHQQTALYIAAASGNVKIADKMVTRSNELTLIRSSQGTTPLYVAAFMGHREMTSYLFSMTPFDKLSHKDRIELLVVAISSDMYDIALGILNKDPSLATAKAGNKKTALHVLAIKPFAVGTKKQLSVWERGLSICFKSIYNRALMQTLAHQLVVSLWMEIRLLQHKQFSDFVGTSLFDAARTGNVEFLIILIRLNPDLIQKVDEKRRGIFHIAVLFRQAAVFNLIYEIGAIKDMILSYTDDKDQNILHLVGKLPPSIRLEMVSGAAFQMQREIMWFKEVEKIVPPSYSEMRNSENLTAWELFRMGHASLRADGEKWMKETVKFYIVVSTLITGLAFAAVSAKPSGNDQDTGTSIWFRVFFMFNAIALLSSSTSILMFLLVLSCRYSEIDFLKALPAKFELGVIALYTSIGGMLGAFCATSFSVFKNQIKWVPMVIVIFAVAPAFSFFLLQSEFLINVIRSTYSTRFLFRPSKKRIF